MANADIDGGILVSNMDAVYQWLKAATVPPAPRPPARKALKPLEPS
jgi:hypothetical protein